MTSQQDSGGRRPPQEQRGERLAAALRANLKRRKMQARGRAGTEKPVDARERAAKESPAGRESRED